MVSGNTLVATSSLPLRSDTQVSFNAGTTAISFTTPMPSTDYFVDFANVKTASGEALNGVYASSLTVNGFTVNASEACTGDWAAHSGGIV